MKKLIKFVLFVALITVAIGAVASFASRKKFASMSDDEIRAFLANKLEGTVADDQLASIQDAVIAGVRARSGSEGDHYAEDVQEAVEALPSIEICRVEWLTSPVWSTERINPAARARLNSDYTVTLRRKDGSLVCPSCGSVDVSDQSAAGPTRCRSVAWCNSCRNVVEVMR